MLPIVFTTTIIRRPMENHYATFDQQEQLIDIAEEANQSFWASKLGVSKEMLKTAIRATHSLDYEQLKAYFGYSENYENYKLQHYVKH